MSGAQRQKGINLLCLMCCMAIFGMTVMLKIEAWAKTKEAEVQLILADSAWNDYLLTQTSHKILNKLQADSNFNP